MFRKKNTSKVIFSLAIGIIVWVFFWWNNAGGPPGEVFIVYDGSLFSPEKIEVRKGGKVTFQNESEGDFWPASDFHPNNGAYPDFDSKKPISKGNTWEFTFEEIGIWGYHDHLSPFHKGEIVVKDNNNIPLLFKNRCGDIADYQGREVCWYRQMKKEIEKNGISGALKLLTDLYTKEPLFGQGCHDITHLIGDDAYRKYKAGETFKLGKETSYCGYGFYHGFVEAMLYTTGDYGEIRNFCESLKNFDDGGGISNAIYACYHGIGHSTFDIHDPALWGDESKMALPAIKTCEKVTLGLEEEKTKQCVTGVFNALGIAYSNDQYNLKLNSKDPVWFCRGFNPVYKKACFIEASLAWIHKEAGEEKLNFKKGADFIASTQDETGEEVAMNAFASEYTRLAIGNFNSDQMVENCKSIKKELFEPCMKGVEEGFFLWGKPEEEYKLALSFCSSNLLTETEKEKCFKNVLPDLSSFYSQEKKNKICANEIEEKYRDFCN